MIPIMANEIEKLHALVCMWIERTCIYMPVDNINRAIHPHTCILYTCYILPILGINISFKLLNVSLSFIFINLVLVTNDKS